MNKIIPQEQNFYEWYTSVCTEAKLFTYYNVKGCINWLPNGWKIWELIVENFNSRFAKMNVKNVQLPLFIKMSDFMKEKEHIEGFAPECFFIDNIGQEKLLDRLIVRPTSEVPFSLLFKDLVHSYNDLPIKLNQWCSVYRAEKNTKPLLRGCEFFWHEMHCLFGSEQEAVDYAIEINKLYNSFCKDVCYLPVLSGKKTEGEKFAGAEITLTREVLSKDGQLIQTGTSHYLGQNFSKMYDLKYQTKENKLEFPYYTSHGMTTRLIGTIIVTHSDNKGLVLPFELAPYQVAICGLFINKNPKVKKIMDSIKKITKKYRTFVDETDNGFGYKISQQEVIGTPFSIFVGPKEAEENLCMFIRRDNGEKQTISIKKLPKFLLEQKKLYYKSIYESAKKRLESSIVEINSVDELKEIVAQGKIGLAYWGGTVEDEKKIKELTTATPRCVKETLTNSTKKCFFTGNPAKQVVYFARAY